MDEEDQIGFGYERALDFKTIAANGACGSITSRGDIRFELLIEYPATGKELYMIMKFVRRKYHAIWS
jgi:hypothetical protein